MGTRHVRTMYDIAVTGHHVKALCNGCGNAKIFDGARIWWLFSTRKFDQSVKTMARYFRCSACGSKNIAAMMTFEQPTGPQPPGPSDREWKVHVRRLRD